MELSDNIFIIYRGLSNCNISWSYIVFYLTVIYRGLSNVLEVTSGHYLQQFT